MKRTIMSLIAAVAATVAMHAQTTPAEQMEQLSRGVVALKSQSGGQFVSWRLFGTDPRNVSFDVLRNDQVIARDLRNSTCYSDASGSTSSQYKVVTRIGGTPVDTTEAVTPWNGYFMQLTLDRPTGGTTASGTYTYTPNDCSVGDVDGDGNYELIVKWDPTNSKDNAKSGYTGSTVIDCYTLKGEKLWRIDLGPNIRSGAHYVQFLVYDFDGDGLAELICKTAPGSVDGQGNYVSAAADDSSITGTDNSRDYRNSSGHVTAGPEYLTVFNGLTGKAMHTIWYNPNRAGNYGETESLPSEKSFWGDTSANRSERYLAAVAHLDKGMKTASAIMTRGYYARAYVWAVDYKNGKLTHRWLNCSSSKTAYSVTDAAFATKSYTVSSPTSGSGSATMYGNGNHNLSIADVDGDGKDEILWGSAACDDDGRVLYGVGFGHGDAMHVADLLPDRDGLEVFDVHEEKGTYAWDLHDAATGKVLLKGGPSGVDNGRGIAAHVDANHREAFFSSSAVPQTLSCLTGDTISQNGPTIQNYSIYWDGDLLEEYLGDISHHNSPFLEKWNGDGCSRMFIAKNNLYEYGNSKTCNDTKGTPCLQADILGDWREEIVFWDSSDSTTLNIFSSSIATERRVVTLMHDHTYRMGVAWQNVGYNQPPHLGYYLPDADFSYQANPETEVTATLTHTASSFCGSDADTYTSTLDAEKEHVNNSKFRGTWQGAAYADFDIDLTGNDSVITATLKFTGYGETRQDRNCDVMLVNEGVTLDYSAISAGNAKVNAAATTLTSVSFPKNSSQRFTVDVTEQLKTIISQGQTFIVFKFTNNPGGGDIAGKASALAPTLTITRVQKPYAKGDVNGDGMVGIADIVAVTNVMASITTDADVKARADVNGDTTVGIADIVAITNIMAGK